MYFSHNTTPFVKQKTAVCIHDNSVNIVLICKFLNTMLLSLCELWKRSADLLYHYDQQRHIFLICVVFLNDKLRAWHAHNTSFLLIFANPPESKPFWQRCCLQVKLLKNSASLSCKQVTSSSIFFFISVCENYCCSNLKKAEMFI